MLAENIRKGRQKAGMSQEELAVRIHVVRQTVSKWENGLSVPDADQLVRLSQELNVSVNELLGSHMDNETDPKEIAGQLKEANAEIARLSDQYRMQSETARIRGLLIFLAFAVMIANAMVLNEILRLAISAVLVLLMLGIFRQNLELLSRTLDPDADTKSIRLMTVFDILLAVLVFGTALLVKLDVISLSKSQEQLFAALLTAGIMIIAGILAPRLPYNRHTGLRLPWTVRDEKSWNVAHRCLGMISIPTALVYLALALRTQAFESLSITVILLWIAVPSVLSLLAYRKPS
ncbi:MAG: XRE family transcriptional regulator [Solobacterium sp.]|nr:XRE family transcriptional regulator [Solobacterium sp.]